MLVELKVNTVLTFPSRSGCGTAKYAALVPPKFMTLSLSSVAAVICGQKFWKDPVHRVLSLRLDSIDERGNPARAVGRLVRCVD